MQVAKRYERLELTVLVFQEDVVTTSGLPGSESDLYDKGVEDFFGA